MYETLTQPHLTVPRKDVQTFIVEPREFCKCCLSVRGQRWASPVEPTKEIKQPRPPRQEEPLKIGVIRLQNTGRNNWREN